MNQQHTFAKILTHLTIFGGGAMFAKIHEHTHTHTNTRIGNAKNQVLGHWWNFSVCSLRIFYTLSVCRLLLTHDFFFARVFYCCHISKNNYYNDKVYTWAIEYLDDLFFSFFLGKGILKKFQPILFGNSAYSIMYNNWPSIKE